VLRLEDDHGWATCARGHRVRLIRADGSSGQIRH
jgi:hypothetical protein